MPTQLCVKSYFSLLNGIMSPEDIVLTAKELGYQSVALTDTHVLHGVLEFAKAAQKHNIKPIFGMEITIQQKDTMFTSLVIAKNNEGYLNLIKISNIINKQKYITINALKGLVNNLWVIIYNENGPFEEDLIKSDFKKVEEKLMTLKEQFPSMILGISHQESNFFKPLNKTLITLGHNLKIPMVALPKVYYIHENDANTLRLLNAIKEQIPIHSEKLVSKPNRNFLSKKTMEELYDDSLLEMSAFIASESNVDVFRIKTSLPIYATGANVSNAIYLKQLATFGLKKRLQGRINEEYLTRLNYELDVIIRMDFVDYFLIVYDLIRFAKQSNIYVGPGRGSSAGSLIAYSLGITDIDPITYNLLFERFLNPMRQSMPDIDIDFPDDKRHLVIQYVKNKYGEAHVAHIPTFGTLKARQAFRDSARAYQIPLSTVDTISKLIGTNTLKEAIQNKKMLTIIESQKDLKEAYKGALSIEGIPRHSSLHAAGIVLSDKPLEDVAPTFEIEDEMRVLQYSMEYLESIGLIKIDFLGLKNLTLIDRISTSIQQEHPNFKITDIPLNEPHTFELLRKGDTSGIFQLESKGMTKLLIDARVDKFTDIVDVIALYRPGPMENIPMYLEARRNINSIHYLHERLKPITQNTYGILIYQEQIMEVAQVFAGFSLAKADILRKAMSKKDGEKLESLRHEFIEGCLKNEYELDFSETLFDLIYKFANYGFNKSHSVAYGLVAYQLAYLKANYSLFFYLHLLNSVIGNPTKTSEYIAETKQRGIKIVGLQLDSSSYEYTLDEGKIRLPLTLIKGISKKSAELIRNDVLVHGSYTTFYNAVARLLLLKLNQGHIENIIKSGAMDYFGHTRYDLLSSLPEATGYAKLITIETQGQISIKPDLISEPIMKQGQRNDKMQFEYELETLGFYVSSHPLTLYKEQNNITDIYKLSVGRNLTIAGVIQNIKTHYTKNGDLMAFVRFKDEYDTIDVVVFPKVYQKVHTKFEKGVYYRCVGSIKEPGSFILDSIEKIDI